MRTVGKEELLRNCFLSSLDDLGNRVNRILPISLKQIDAKMEDIGTDIYHASLPAEALQNANRSKTKAAFLNHLLLIIQLFYHFFANNA